MANTPSTSIEIVQGDITQLDVEMIVNAANSALLGGGGVDGAIHRAAGPELLVECRTLGGAHTGQVKLTRGYRLKAKYVAHAVGPIWHGGNQGEDNLLRCCYREAMKLAYETGVRSIAFPAISTGVYGFPLERATRIARDTLQADLREHPDCPMRVVLCTFSARDRAVYEQVLAEDG